MEKAILQMGRSADLKNEILLKLVKHLLLVHQLCDPLAEMDGQAVHEIRRTFKKCRSLLRLIRDPLGDAPYRKENLAMRKMHRLLSAAREADVFYALLEQVRLRSAGLSEHAWFQETLHGAAVQSEREREYMVGAGAPSRIRKGVQKCITRISQYSIEGEGFLLIEGGLERTFRQGKLSLKDAYRPDAPAEALHLHRKRVKDLQFQLAFVKTIFPEILHPTMKVLQKISDTLGDFNDSRGACHYLDGLTPDVRASHEEIQVLREQLRQDMQRSRLKAGGISRRFYAEKAGAFVSRMHAYWDQFEPDPLLPSSSA
jgi:CHAD domain-containing protein